MVTEFVARDLVEQAAAKGIQFTVEDGGLRTRSRPGAIDADMAALIRNNKVAIMDWVAGNAQLVRPERHPLRPRSDRASPAPLSLAQERFWFMDRFTQLGQQYNLYAALRIHGGFDSDIARQALQLSIDRHETLRMIYWQDVEDGVLHQAPVADTQLRMIVHDLRNMPQEGRELRLTEVVHENAAKPFDLAKDLMFRASLVRLRDDEVVLLISMPHIAADGWSMLLLEKEFVHSYGAMREGGEVHATPLAITYGDYAVWQRERMHDREVARQLAYWERTLRDAPPAHTLPLDRPRRNDSKHPAGRFGFMLDRSLYEALKTFAYESNATIFMCLHAAFAIVLARLSDNDDIVVGTPVMNRLEKPLEALFGCFLNTLALRVQYQPDESFRDFLTHVRDVNLDALGNQEITFEQVVDRMRPERSGLHAPLFQIMFSMGMPRTGAARGVPGLDIKVMEHVATVAKFDLSLYAQDEGPDLFFAIEYDADLFDLSSIERLASHFNSTLEQVATNPDVALSSLSLAPESRLREISQSWGSGASQPIPSGSVDEAFERHARERPGVAALVHEGTSYGYAELNARANRLAHVLRLRGVGPEVTVGICLSRSVDLAVSILAVWKAGGAYVPLDPDNPPARLNLMLEDAQVSCVLGDEASLQALNVAMPLALDSTALRAELDMAPANDPVRDGPASSGRLAYVMFTSGSSGRPKGVRVEHGSVMNLAVGLDMALAGIGVSGPVRWAWNASYGFDASLQALVQWRHGATLHLLPTDVRRDPLQLREYLTRESIQVLDATPLQVEALLEVQGAPLPSLVIGGEAISASLWAGIVAHYAGRPEGALNAYGPTETTVDATMARIEGPLPRIGRPMANVHCLVLDRQSQAQPEGVPGELYIGGAGVARGYAGREAETAERFVELPGHTGRYYRSGDRVRWSEDGSLEYLGRLDGQVKLRGYRVEPEEVAQALRAEASVAAAAVVVREGTGGPRLVGYVVASTDAPLEAGWEDGLRDRLRMKLPSHMVPAALIRLDQLPTTVNGKLDMRALPEEDERRIDRVLPATRTEILVAEIWTEVLGCTQIDVRDNFFTLGGHSLMATRVAARLLERLNIEVPLQGLFEEPQLIALSAAIDSGRWGHPALTVPPIQPAGREADVDNVFVQSHAQQRLWFLHQLDPASTAYNVHSLYGISGELDLEALQHSLNDLVVRHESLRTTFAMELGNRLVQIVAATASVRIATANFEFLAPEDARERGRQLIRDNANRPFDLQRGPLLRVSLLRFAPDYHMLMIGMHHIITDAWSMDVFLREFSTLYAGHRKGVPAKLEHASLQYADYATWQDEWMNFGVLEELLFYWQEHMRGAPPELRLITDHVSNLRQITKSDELVFRLDKSLTESAKRFADQSRATLFMVLLAGFKALLCRYSDQDDIVIGTPVANRASKELESLVGFFVNTLVLRTDLSGDPAFSEIVNRVRGVTLGGLANQRLPLERLIERLEPDRRWARSPLFRAMFVMQNGPQHSFELDGLQLEPLPIASVEAKFDLMLAMAEGEGGLEGSIVYNADIFDRATIEQMSDCFRLLLQAALEQPKAPLSALSLLEDDDREMLRSWGRGEPAPAAVVDVCARFEMHASLAPDAVAVEQGDRSIGYARLDAWAQDVAHQLRERGIGSGDVVALALDRSIETAAGMLGVLKAGAAFLPLDMSHPAERLNFIIEDASVRAVLVHGSKVEEQSFPGCECIAIDQSEPGSSGVDQSTPGAPNFVTSSAIDAAYVLYTSGSTGRPKGVKVSRGALANLADWYGRTMDIGPSDRCSQVAGAMFDASMVEWWGGLTQGARVRVVDDATRTSPAALIRWIDEHAITHAFAPTPVAQVMMAESWPQGVALRVLLVGGDRLISAPQAGMPFSVYNAYGPSEATVITTCSRVEPASGTGLAPHIGRPIQGVEVRVLDAAGKPVPIGIVGELYIGGIGLADGYINRPEMTSEAFIVDPEDPEGLKRLYRTGDRARYRRDRNLDFVGRLDDQVKIRGYRIELGEVQTVLQELEGVRQACVVMREDVPGDRRLVGYVVPEKDASSTCADVWLSGLRARLPQYMVPASVVSLEQLPLNRSGKIDVKALPTPLAEHFGSQNEVVPPGDFVEKELVAIWEDILNYSPASLHHNFFKYGGHSLSALSLRSVIESRLGVSIELFELFENGSIRHLANHVRSLRGVHGLIAEEPLQRKASIRSRGSWLTRWAGRLFPWSPQRRSPQRVDPADLVKELSRDGTGQPVFLIQAATGGVLCYASLVGSLKGERPIYGLNAPGEILAEQISVESMAELYIQAVKRIQPEGPYILGGWSLGGVMAYEVARKLSEAGDRIELVAMLDSYPSDGRLDAAKLDENELLDKFVRELLSSSGLNVSHSSIIDAELDEDGDALSQAMEVAKSLGVLPQDFGRESFSAHFVAFKNIYEAWLSYKPVESSVPVYLVVADDSFKSMSVNGRSPIQSWADCAGGGVTMEVVDGDHYSMLRSPVSERIAALLRRRMAGGVKSTPLVELAVDSETADM
jgi:amino acid adenylation domain-containing protein